MTLQLVLLICIALQPVFAKSTSVAVVPRSGNLSRATVVNGSVSASSRSISRSRSASSRSRSRSTSKSSGNKSGDSSNGEIAEVIIEIIFWTIRYIIREAFYYRHSMGRYRNLESVDAKTELEYKEADEEKTYLMEKDLEENVVTFLICALSISFLVSLPSMFRKARNNDRKLRYFHSDIKNTVECYVAPIEYKDSKIEDIEMKRERKKHRERRSKKFLARQLAKNNKIIRIENVEVDNDNKPLNGGKNE